jgi:nicotinamidase-related amidase
MKKVLIVVDMLNDFIDKDGVLSLGQSGFDIVPVIARKVYLARRQGDMVLYLNDAHDINDKEFNRFPSHAVVGTWGAEVIPELTPVAGDIIIPKKRYSGFFGTCLQETLSTENPDIIEVCGCCTSICVAGTIEELANRDYTVVVDRKAVADFDQDAHEFFLEYQFPRIFGINVL